MSLGYSPAAPTAPLSGRWYQSTRQQLVRLDGAGKHTDSPDVVVAVKVAKGCKPAAPLDRKSTRLNSSHPV